MSDRVEIGGLYGDSLHVGISRYSGGSAVSVSADAGLFRFGVYFRPADARALAAAITLQAERIEREAGIAEALAAAERAA